MEIKFNSIYLDGFMSYDKCQVPLDSLGLVRVIGINNYETKATSNGSGKSSIFSAILWVLTGKTERGAKEVANSILNKGVSVSLDFSIDKTHYIITRSKGHSEYGTGLVIDKDGTDVSGGTTTKSNKILESILGKLDYSLLTSIIILSQGLPSRLSNLSPSGRKAKLEDLSDTEYYISNFKNSIDSAKANILAKLSQYNSESTKYSTSISLESKHISDYTITLSELISKRSNSISKEDKDKYNREISELQLSLSDLSLAQQKSSNDLAQSKSVITNLTYQIKSLEQENSKYFAKYKELSADNSCPTCHQKVSLDLGNQLKSTIKSAVADIKSKLLNNSKLLEAEQSHKSEIEGEYSKLSSKISEVNSRLSELVNKIKNYVDSDQSEELLKSSIETSQLNIENYKNELDKVNKFVDKYTEDLDITKWIESQISRKFRSYLLDGVIDYFNNKASEYSKYLFDKAEVTLYSNGNNIDIYLGDRNFNNLSSGEARRVDIILQLIERDLARSESGFISNILVMDEILDGLDSVGIDSVVDLIEYKSPDVSSMFIISHKDDINLSNDIVITIEKDSNQISHLTKGLEFVDN